jgi:hypothetical protein
MRRMLVAACFVALLIVPLLGRADEWERAPSGSDEGGDMAAPSGGDDSQVIGDFLAQARAAHAGIRTPCEVVGMFGDMAAVFRDQGVTPEHQRENIDSNFDRTAADKHVPHKWIRPIMAVVHREIAYVYSHPELSADQVKSHWLNMCEAQRGGG